MKMVNLFLQNTIGLFLFKKKLNKVFICIFVSLLSFQSCQSDTLVSKERKTESTEDKLIQINQLLISKESAKIDAFILKNSWEMKSTGSGLRYGVTEEGRGRRIELNEVVKLNFKISDLSGNLLFFSEAEKPLEFKTGLGQVPKGLEEAVLLMKKGSRARLILPAHLAFGLEGSGNIKPASSIVYEINIINN